MQLFIIINLVALLQVASAAVVTQVAQPPPPKCNADNCLRGLFGTNAKASAANVAACSTGLSTVTVSISGSATTTLTATVAPPAAASVCDGQGVEKRASRFSSACSCNGISPVTTTTVVPSITSIGQLAVATNVVQCPQGLSFEAVQQGRTTNCPSYEVPQDGKIISASTFDGYTGIIALHIYRPSTSGPICPNDYTLIGKSDILATSGDGTVKPFVLPGPIDVRAGDKLGIFERDAGCLINSPTDSVDYKEVTIEGVVGEPFSTNGKRADILLNVAAVLQFNF